MSTRKEYERYKAIHAEESDKAAEALAAIKRTPEWSAYVHARTESYVAWRDEERCFDGLPRSVQLRVRQENHVHTQASVQIREDASKEVDAAMKVSA